MPATLGRNDPCHCGSGKKYKKCHLEKDEAAGRKEREKAALNAAKVAKEAEEEKTESTAATALQKKPPAGDQSGWMKRMASKVGLFRGSSQRRILPQNKGGG